MYGILTVIHFIVALAIVLLILLQQGKGAQTGAAFGTGASSTIFGSQGSGNFLSRTTWMFVSSFFIINLILGYMGNQSFRQSPLLPLKHEQALPEEKAAEQTSQSNELSLPND